MIDRDITAQVRRAARQFPVVTVTGPRQSGKSTLCRALFPKHQYANLEAPDVRAFAAEDPRAFLAQFGAGAIIDEVQRAPELPSYLQELIDANPKHGRWVLTGSQNLLLLESVSQSLAGRSAVLNLLPFSRAEVVRFAHHPTSLNETLLFGGYPRIFDQRLDPSDWLQSYVATYVERDVRTVSNVGDLATFQGFVELCAGRTAQLLNYSALAADCGIAQPTAKAWMSLLETAFIVFRLPAWSGNLRKRLTRMPKLHFYDSGLVCWLLGIRNVEQLRAHPLRGAIFESWVVSEIHKYRCNAGQRGGMYFYREHGGAEADLLIDLGTRFAVVEAKAAQTPSRSLLDGTRRVAATLQTLRPCTPTVVYGGEARQERDGGAILPWSQLHIQNWA